MSTPQWFLHSKDYLFFFFFRWHFHVSARGQVFQKPILCLLFSLLRLILCLCLADRGGREIETFIWKVFNGPRLGTPRVTLACILVVSAQSHGHRAARQAGKCSLTVPSRSRKGCGGHLVSLFAGRHCIHGPRTCKSVAHEVDNE